MLPADVRAIVLFGSRARARALLLPLLPVDLDLLITDAPTAAHWTGSRWHGQQRCPGDQPHLSG